MWQAQITLDDAVRRDEVASKAYLCNTRGIWEDGDSLTAYFSDRADLESFLLVVHDDAVLSRKVSEKVDWLAYWKKFHKTIRVAPFVIVPDFRRRTVLPPGRRRIVIRPSFAFGTGSHATTKLCLRYLVRTVTRGMRVLDMGTGSGILGIAAEKLGAASVLGVDIDPVAVREARENAARNRCSRFVAKERLPARPARFDLIVCNILLADILSLRETLTSRLAPGGTLILSGLLAEQEDEVTAAFSPMFSIAGVRRMTDPSFSWIALLLVRT